MNQSLKEKLMSLLRSNTLIALRPSPIQGIGVFAITDIEAGRGGLFSDDNSEWVSIPKQEVATLPEHSRFMVENHCLYDDENYFIPEYGFKLIDPVIFLNHSDQPNLRSINDGQDFITLRAIRAGEELFIDYGEIVEHE